MRRKTSDPGILFFTNINGKGKSSTSGDLSSKTMKTILKLTKYANLIELLQ